MASENAKHWNKDSFLNKLAAMEKTIQGMQEDLASIRENFEEVIADTPLGELDKLADAAYQIILTEGVFTSHACAKLKIHDATKRQRLFTVLGKRHKDVGTRVDHLYGDKRKILVAFIDEKKLQVAKQDPDQEVKEFVQANKPTKSQLIAHFQWVEPFGTKKIGHLVNQKKMVWNTDHYMWLED